MTIQKEPVFSAFYLHGGPGLSAIPEREALGESLGIYWWDQPRPVAGATHAFAALIDATEAEFKSKAADNGGQMALIANSFGAQLALHLAHHIPEQISSITLLAPAYDLGAGFVRFARRIMESSMQREHLLAAINAFEAEPGNIARFWELMTMVVATPNFSDHYWNPTSVRQQKWFGNLLMNPAVFDFAACQVVINDFFNYPHLEAPSQFNGPVSIVLGKHDPLNDPVTTGQAWKKHFPQANVHIVDAGHLMHLELPLQEWIRL